MLFNSLEFIFVFLPLALLAFFLASRYTRGQIPVIVLVIASLAFYSYWYLPNLAILGASIVINFFFGKMVLSAKDEKAKKLRTGIAIGANLGLLGYFKYYNFFAENIALVLGEEYSTLNIMLPLGISFFTFQQISYLVDCYKRKTEADSFFKYVLFISFFAHLIAGPIVLHEDVRKQFASPSFGKFNFVYFAMGTALFVIGLGKKVLLADQLATISTPIFKLSEMGEKLQFFESWGAALAFTYQLYFDFSGYSDMAIGLALMFGIWFPLNFDAPYKATSIIEFWRRWHITFSNFLKNYLYIPLGGNRKGPTRTMINLVLVMFLGGLWHGAGWTFIIWGLLHGTFLAINHLYRQNSGILKPIFSFPPIAYVLTMGCIVLSWVFFRAETFDGALNMLAAMGGGNNILVPSEIFAFLPAFTHGFLANENAADGLYWCGNLTWDSFTLIIAAFLIALFMPSSADVYRKFVQEKGSNIGLLNRWMGLYLGIIFTLCVLMVYAKTASEFLYFQF